MLDARDRALGSTAASTALLQYEIDTHLTDLARQIGAERATRAYRACAASFEMLERRFPELLPPADYRRRESLYLAADESAMPALRAELEARRLIGLACEWLEGDEPQRRFGCRRPGAILSALAAEIDPVRFTQALICGVERHGVRRFARSKVGSITEHRPGPATGHGKRAQRRCAARDRGSRIRVAGFSAARCGEYRQHLRRGDAAAGRHAARRHHAAHLGERASLSVFARYAGRTAGGRWRGCAIQESRGARCAAVSAGAPAGGRLSRLVWRGPARHRLRLGRKFRLDPRWLAVHWPCAWHAPGPAIRTLLRRQRHHLQRACRGHDPRRSRRPLARARRRVRLCEGGWQNRPGR